MSKQHYTCIQERFRYTSSSFSTRLQRNLLMRHFIKEVDAPRRTPETLICISQLGEV